MEKILMKKALPKKYMHILFNDTKENINAATNNLNNLFLFIGQNVTVQKFKGKEYIIFGCVSNGNKELYIHNAYNAIRVKANELLGVKNKCNRLYVTKYEVKSLRNYTKKRKIIGSNWQLKIPYKVWFLFWAIIELIKEIREYSKIPEDLSKLVGLNYHLAFYNYNINHYNRVRVRIRTDLNCSSCKCEVLLNEDFTSANSPFLVNFEWK